ncbi:MAG: hypothetical protein V3U92_06925 [Cellulophaga sp.]
MSVLVLLLTVSLFVSCSTENTAEEEEALYAPEHAIDGNEIQDCDM